MLTRTLIAAAALAAAGNAAATYHVEDIGGGLGQIRNDFIVYLLDANHAASTGHSPDGLMTFAEAVAWADALEYAGKDDWRLPTVVDRVRLDGPFFNVQDFYWLDGPLPGSSLPPGENLAFDATNRDLYYSPSDTYNYAIAVRNSVVDFPPPIPEPSTYALLLAGLGVVGLYSRGGRRPKA